MGAGLTKEQVRSAARRAFKALAKELPDWKPGSGYSLEKDGDRITWDLLRASNGEACLRYIIYLGGHAHKTIDRAAVLTIVRGGEGAQRRN
jgi:hypothetical protein